MNAPSPCVLVVDDDPAIRLLCRVNLEFEGVRVIEAGTLAEARSAARDGSPDLVLLDVHVAGEDGRELLDELRAEHPYLPVYMLTGTAAFEPRGAAPDGLIAKPFDPTELVRLVRDAIGVARRR